MPLFTITIPASVFNGIVAAIDRQTAQTKRIADLFEAATTPTEPEIPDSLGAQLTDAQASLDASTSTLSSTISAND